MVIRIRHGDKSASIDADAVFLKSNVRICSENIDSITAHGADTARIILSAELMQQSSLRLSHRVRQRVTIGIMATPKEESMPMGRLKTVPAYPMYAPKIQRAPS